MINKITNHYKFNETSGTVASDSAGSSNLTMSKDYWNTGLFGNGLNAIGQSRDVWATASVLLFPRYANFTVMGWCFINNAMLTQGGANYNHGIVNQWQSGNGGRMNILFAGAGHPTPSFGSRFNFTLGGPERIVGSEITNEGWYHFALRRVGDIFTLFVNGVSQGTYTASTWISDINTEIGTFGASANNGIQGIIDEVSFSNEGLTDDEINRHMNYGLTKFEFPYSTGKFPTFRRIVT